MNGITADDGPVDDDIARAGEGGEVDVVVVDEPTREVKMNDDDEATATATATRGAESGGDHPSLLVDDPRRGGAVDTNDAELKDDDGEEGSGDIEGAAEPPAEDGGGEDEEEDDANDPPPPPPQPQGVRPSAAGAAASSSSAAHNARAGGAAGGGGGGGAAAPAPPPAARKKKPTLKKRSRADDAPSTTAKGEATAPSAPPRSSAAASKKRKAQRRANDGAAASGKASSAAGAGAGSAANNPSHQAVRDQMRRVLEEDHYSALGSIVDTDSDSDDGGNVGAVEYKGSVLRLDRPAVTQYAAQYLALLSGGGGTASSSSQAGATGSSSGAAGGGAGGGGGASGGAMLLTSSGVGGSVHSASSGAAAAGAGRDGSSSNKRKDAKSSARSTPVPGALGGGGGGATAAAASAAASHSSAVDAMTKELEDEWEMDGSSIFGQTTGSSNFTWVECDKCKKWRRLRGVVDEKKLPSRWYCSMNKNDPERSKCSAPEEEYDTSHATPESAADARVRKHLRVWVRRLQCNEAYEARLPTQTRGKKKSQSSSKEPYEWIRCCNPGCGKWRSLLRIMEAKAVIEKTQDGEWYCVMNTWDEKVASCAAPQENLPAVGCPPWVLLDDADT